MERNERKKKKRKRNFGDLKIKKNEKKCWGKAIALVTRSHVKLTRSLNEQDKEPRRINGGGIVIMITIIFRLCLTFFSFFFFFSFSLSWE